MSAALSWVLPLWEWFLSECHEHPVHVVVDTLMVVIAIAAMRTPVHKAKVPQGQKPTPEEEEELLAEFVSQPFDIPDMEDDDLPEPPVCQQYEGVHATLDNNERVLNTASFDFLCYATEPEVVRAAQGAIVKYGCGSCGPRGFYGSIQPHVDFEQAVANFLGTQAAIIYSFSFATVSTLIPCFSARGDEILCDAACHNAVHLGCQLSRSRVATFKHNDLDELEQLMRTSHKRAKKLFRRTLVIEGLYRNTGTLCNLPAMVELARRYKYRIVLDDSCGFGALGPNGKGTPDHFGLPTSAVEIYIGAMSTGLGSVGGFCAGRNPMVDHQRLAATGYVFSAALPPYATVSTCLILDLLAKDTARIARLHSNATQFRTFFTSGTYKLPKRVEMADNDMSRKSPVVHFLLTKNEAAAMPSKEARARFADAAQRLLKDGVMAVATQRAHLEEPSPPVGLRVCIKSEFTGAQLRQIAAAVSAALAASF